MAMRCAELWVPRKVASSCSGASAQVIFEPKDKSHEQKKSSNVRSGCGCGAVDF